VLELPPVMKDDLFTSRDVCRAFPWISPQILHYRIASGLLPIKYSSKGPGLPNQFRHVELVQAGVLDELASLGLLHDRKHVDTDVCTDGVTTLLNDPFGIPDALYLEANYNVIIVVIVRRERTPPRRKYGMTYYAANDQTVKEMADSWLDTAGISRDQSMAFLAVRRFYKIAAAALGW